MNVLPSSRVLANDGVGTDLQINYGRGNFALLLKPPAGPRVFSDTHPFENIWYNNPNPTFTWEKDPGVTSFSYVLDDKPFTVADNTEEGADAGKGFEDVADGVRYFHIKAKRNNTWGETTHFTVRIDSSPPAEFKPRAEVLQAAILSRVFVYFETTDRLSGIDHYEIGIIDRKSAPEETPVFVEAKSPYQIPEKVSGNVRIIVRAFDVAGNVRDGVVDVYAASSIIESLSRNIPFWFMVLLLLFFIILNFFFTRKNSDVPYRNTLRHIPLSREIPETPSSLYQNEDIRPREEIEKEPTPLEAPLIVPLKKPTQALTEPFDSLPSLR